MFNEAKTFTKAVTGPGGLNCSCCRRDAVKANSKRRHWRSIRRRSRSDLRILADE